MTKDDKKAFVGALMFSVFAASVILSFVKYLDYLHGQNVEDYILSNGKIYSWQSYSCHAGVMYKDGRSATVMLDRNGKPITCEIKRMTNKQFEEM